MFTFNCPKGHETPNQARVWGSDPLCAVWRNCCAYTDIPLSFQRRRQTRLTLILHPCPHFAICTLAICTQLAIFGLLPFLLQRCCSHKAFLGICRAEVVQNQPRTLPASALGRGSPANLWRHFLPTCKYLRIEPVPAPGSVIDFPGLPVVKLHTEQEPEPQISTSLCASPEWFFPLPSSHL